VPMQIACRGWARGASEFRGMKISHGRLLSGSDRTVG
jgi:hypothetical protein